MGIKLTIEEMRALATKRGGKCLSNNYINAHSKLRWQCNKGHIWEATPHAVKNSKTWCPVCAGVFPLQIFEFQKIAREKGGKLLSKRYINLFTKLKFKCKKGHIWEASPGSIKHVGTWCPICSNPYMSEEMCRATFQDIFGVTFNKGRFDWLRNENGNQMELDGYNDKLNIAFEYQGRQHFDLSSRFIRTSDKLKQRIKDDKLKAKLCIKHGVKLFILTNKTNFTDFSKEIKEQAKKLNISGYNYDIKINFNDLDINKSRLDTLRKILKSRKIKLLTKNWRGAGEKYKVRCLIDGNIWEAVGRSLTAGSGCEKCGRKNTSNKLKLGLIGLQDYASSHGGVVISNKYIDCKSSYRFKCKYNHIFNGGIFRNMKHRNNWCPICDIEKRNKK